jgi:competence protein ComEA
VLPRPRRRVDVDVVRARLQALASGSAPATSFDEVSGESPDVPAVTVVRPGPLRPVVVALVAAALTAWVVVRVVSGPAPSPVELVAGTPVPLPSSSVSGSASPSATVVPELVVHVIGDVRRPGLVRLAAGSRVADAVAAAGGLSKGGSSGELNHARPVVDGEQIAVSRDSPPAAAPVSAGSGGDPASVVVDLNTATAAELDTLPGVGPVTASRILEWRAAHGRFASIDQLREVSGIGARTFELLAPHVRV